MLRPTPCGSIVWISVAHRYDVHLRLAEEERLLLQLRRRQSKSCLVVPNTRMAFPSRRTPARTATSRLTWQEAVSVSCLWSASTVRLPQVRAVSFLVCG